MRSITPPRRRIVGIGGGNGLSVLLSGLERYSRHPGEGRVGLDISAIVSVADDGGSTGLLRQHLGIPAVGDLRNCIVALSRGNPLWHELFQYRFTTGNGLAGHALGNIIVAALVQQAGSVGAAVAMLARPLRMRGRVMPVTEEPVTLGASFDTGADVVGESRIRHSGRRIARVWLSPRDPSPAAGVLEAIDGADAIVLGPGSLYTSIVPNLLVSGVAQHIRACQALRIFVCNVMTEPGETDGFDVADHLAVLEQYLGRGSIDVFVINVSALPRDLTTRYAEAGAVAVAWDRSRGLGGAHPYVADLLEQGQTLGRHEARKLAETVVSVARCLRRRGMHKAPVVAMAAMAQA